MNVSTYMFGKLSSGYTQYPDDNNGTLYKSVAEHIQSESMIAIRREGSLLHCIYIRSLSSEQDDRQYLGLALEFNDVYCNDLSKLFSLFDEELTKIVLNGKIVELSVTGNIVAKVSRLYCERAEIGRISKSLLSAVEGLSSSFIKLPPVNYSVAPDEVIELTDLSSNTDITRVLKDYNAINVYRKNETSALNEYSKRLRTLNQQIALLLSEKSALKSELSKIKRQKKRTKTVTILSLIIFAGLLAFISVSTNLNDKVSSLASDNLQLTTEIEEKSGIISNQNAAIQDYKESEKQLDVIYSELESHKRKVIVLDEKIATLSKELESKSEQLILKEDEVLKINQLLSNAENERDYYRKLYKEKEQEAAYLQTELKQLKPKNSRRRK